MEEIQCYNTDGEPGCFHEPSKDCDCECHLGLLKS